MHTECGLLGLYNVDHPAHKAYYGLHALQHRGQESAGIYVADGENFDGYKNLGLAREVFTDQDLDRLDQGGVCHAVAHVRYAGQGAKLLNEVQPLFFSHLRAQFAVCSSGALLNYPSLNHELQEAGAIFQSHSSCEILTHFLVRHEQKFLPALQDSLNRLQGSYCFVFLRRNRLIAVRDPLGFMPLCYGKLGDGYVVASESCALDTLGAELIRDIKPGEIIDISPEGVHSYTFDQRPQTAYCLMEYIYFARPDSYLNGINVHQARYQAGRELARESAVDCDLVIGVPDSSLSAAQGFADEAGLPNRSGLIKNKYSGRSFIEPSQEKRELAVYLKLSPIRYLIEGKRITLIDDSIVRGTTSLHLIKLLREYGAKEVHMRIASPRMIRPCFYGVDSTDYHQLMGASHDVDEMCQILGADSLAFLSIEGLCRAAQVTRDQVCQGCFTGAYPTPLYDQEALYQKTQSELAKLKQS